MQPKPQQLLNEVKYVRGPEITPRGRQTARSTELSATSSFEPQSPLNALDREDLQILLKLLTTKIPVFEATKFSKPGETKLTHFVQANNESEGLQQLAMHVMRLLKEMK